jgi:uncharacterized membrane protein (DUF485 family)
MPDNRQGVDKGAGIWTLTAAVLFVYFAFILTIAFAPEIFGRPVAEGARTSVGLVVGTIIIVVCMVLAGVYTHVKNREDARNDAEARQP